MAMEPHPASTEWGDKGPWSTVVLGTKSQVLQFDLLFTLFLKRRCENSYPAKCISHSLVLFHITEKVPCTVRHHSSILWPVFPINMFIHKLIYFIAAILIFLSSVCAKFIPVLLSFSL